MTIGPPERIEHAPRLGKTVNEQELMADAERRAAAYAASVADRPPYPDQAALANLAGFNEPFPEKGWSASETLDRLDKLGGPATAVGTGPRYFGYVVGGVLPSAAAAERLVLAWDQRASTFASSPVSATIEQVAACWLLDALALPVGSAVGFGTSATACTITCLATARRTLMARQGWDWDRDGFVGAQAAQC